MILKSFPNDRDDALFDIDSYFYMIQAYASQQQSSSLRIPKERLYRLYQEEKCLWGKLSEADNATILGDAKTPHKPSCFFNLHNVTLVGIIKSSYRQFDFGDTPNRPSNNDLIDEYHHTYSYGDTYMILANLSKRYKIYPEDISKVLSVPNS